MFIILRASIFQSVSAQARGVAARVEWAFIGVSPPHGVENFMAGSRQAAAELVARIQQLARPRYVNGVWKKPLVSGRELAAARRALAAEGMDWPVRPLRDRSQDKPFKLNRREREREER